MTTSAPLRLTLQDKLDALRKLDSAARWESLDDQRYCTRCDRVITGRQIEVAGGTRAHGPLRLECPTQDCEGTPADWTSSAPDHKRRAREDGERGNDGATGTLRTGYVQIRGGSEGISITHNGRAAVIRRTPSGPFVPFRDIAELNEVSSRGRVVSWLVRRAAAVATDCRSVLGLLRPRQRAHFHPLQ